MSGGLPITIDPVLLAEQGARLTGRIAVRAMERLRTMLVDDAGEADVDLHFGRMEGSGLRRMHGRVNASVHVACQRCLESMTLELQARPDTIVLREGEAESGLPPEADVSTVNASVVLTELVEDELLLAMPMVPMHALDECPARKFISNTGSEKHPFAALLKLRDENN